MRAIGEGLPVHRVKGTSRASPLGERVSSVAAPLEPSFHRAHNAPVLQGAAMSIERLKERLPDHAKDLRSNLSTITSSMMLTPQQAWGTALTASVTSRNAEVVAAIAADAPLSHEAAEAARGAAAIMAMHNIYYRFQHLMGDDSVYAQFPARLRMQILGKPGVDHVDFELWCLAASVITGCDSCVRSHESTVRERGGTAEQVQDAVRIAAVVHAVALTLDSMPVTCAVLAR